MIIIITRIVQEMKHFNESHIGDSVGRVWIYRLVFDVCVCVCVCLYGYEFLRPA